MDLEKFTNELGNVALEGIDSLGDFKFAKIGKQFGVVVNENAIPSEPETPTPETGA